MITIYISTKGVKLKMNFTKIDLETWGRKENYNWFTKKNRRTISMTLNVDATNIIKKIKRFKLRHYPTFVYMISKVLNSNDEFKTSYDEYGNLGIYDVIHPRYPIFHENDKRLSILWTEYSDNFEIFYDRFTNDINIYGENRSMAARGQFPPNCFDVSSLPWSSFTSFDCSPVGDAVWLVPFVMVGKFFEFGEKLLLPVSISVHHATCDGYHVSMFFKKLEELCDKPDKWM